MVGRCAAGLIGALVFGSVAGADTGDVAVPALPGLPKAGAGTGPGQGPVDAYHGADDGTWEYWWFFNHEELIDRRRRLVPEPGPEGYARVVGADRLRIEAALRAVVEKDEDAGLTGAALLALARAEAAAAEDAMLEHAQRRGNLERRRMAILALGVHGSPRVVPWLMDLVLDPKGDVESDLRATAAFALALVEGSSPPPPATGPSLPAPAVAAAPAAPAEAPLLEAIPFAAPASDGATVHPLDAPARCVAWHPFDPVLASGLENGTIALHQVELSRDLKALIGHAGEVVSVAWNGDGDRLLSASADGTVRVWSVRQRRALRTFDAHGGPVVAAAWAADGNRVASLGRDGTLLVWFARTGTVLGRVLEADDPAEEFAWSKDGASLVLRTRSGALRSVDPRGEPGPPLPPALAGGTSWRAVRWSPAGVLAVAGADGAIDLADGAGGRSLGRLEGAGPVALLAGDLDRGVLATVGEDGRTTFWNPVARSASARLAGPARALAVRPGKATVAVVDSGGAVALVEAPASAAIAPAAPPSPTPTADAPSLSVDAAFRALLEPATFSRLPTDVQNAVAAGAGISGHRSLAEPLLQLEGGGRLGGVTRGFLVWGVGRLGDARHAETLWRFLTRDGDVHVRTAAAIGMGLVLKGRGSEPEQDKRVRLLIEVLTKPGVREGNHTVRNALILSLGRIGGERAAAYLNAGLDPRDVGSGLATFGGIVRTSFPSELFEQPHQAIALGLTGEGIGYERVAKRFDHEGSVNFRATLALAIGLHRRGSDEAAQWLRRELERTRNPGFTGYLAIALGLAGDEKAAPLMERWLVEGGPDVETIPHVAIGLALLSRAARAEELLLARLAAKRSSADRRILLYALGLVGSARAAPAVLEALEDASSPAAVRAYAAVAAGELLDRAPRSDLARLRWAFDAAAEPDLVKLRGLFGTP